MKSAKFSRTLLLLVILTVITVFTWLSVSVYLSFNKLESLNIPSSQLQPLNPKLETGVIDKLSKKDILILETSNSTNSPSLKR